MRYSLPKVKNRDRECKYCGAAFSIDDLGLRKYCSISCRTRYHNNTGRDVKYRNSDKGKQTAFAWRLRTNFGITPEQYDQMFKEQGNSCAICQRTEPTGYNWHVDHCHSSGKVRGILCSMCNHALGLLQDNPTLLRKAALYIENS